MSSLITLSNLMPPLAWIGISSVLFAIGDILFRFWNQSHSTLFFAIALVFITVGMFMLAMSFPHQNIAVATVIAILFNITLYLIAAFLIFGDMISIRESIGLLIAFIAIYILETN